MGLLRRIGAVLGIAGAGVAAESGPAHAAEVQGHQETAQTGHVEKYKSPEKTFADARRAIVEALNETTADLESLGERQGDDWEAVVKTEGGKIFAEITVTAGGNRATKRFELRADDNPDESSEKPKIYSFASDLDMDEAAALADARETLKKALGGKRGKKGGDIVAMGE